jgi:hypothetical protein
MERQERMIRRKIIAAVPTALERSVVSTFSTPRQVSWLTGHRSLAGLPIEEFNSGLNIASPLTVNSGATAREFHPLPFSLTD